MLTLVKGMIPVSGVWLAVRSGTGIDTGSIFPFRSVRRIAIAVPSVWVIIIATFSSGILASLV